MDIKSLMVFQTLAETLHYGQAAAVLHMSPSTISRTITRLEEVLNVQLVQRDNRNVILTWQGQKLLKTADDIVSQWQALQYALEREAGIRGKIHLYCSVTASYSIMPQLLKQIRQRYRDVEVHLTTGDAASAVSHVANKLSDLSIAPKPVNLADNLVFTPIVKTPLVFIAPSDDVLKLGINQEQINWQSVPFVLAEQGNVRDEFDLWAKQNTVKVHNSISVSGHEAIISMVALGYGVGLVPMLVLQNSPLIDQVTVLKVDDMTASFDVGFCCRRSRLDDPLIQAIWNLDLPQ